MLHKIIYATFQFFSCHYDEKSMVCDLEELLVVPGLCLYSHDLHVTCQNQYVLRLLDSQTT